MTSRFVTLTTRSVGSPAVVVLLLAVASNIAGYLIGGVEILSAVLLVWFALPCAVVLVLCAAADPVQYVPRSILSAEAPNLGRFFRTSFGLIAAGVVASMSTFAVQRDLTAPVDGSSQIWELTVVAGTAIVIVGTVRAVWIYAARLLTAGAVGRQAAVRKVAGVLVVWSGARQLLPALHSRGFVRWQQFLADSTWTWAAMGSILILGPLVAYLIQVRW